MPYLRKRTGRRARVGTSFRTGAFMPHMSKFDQRDVRMEKAGIDIIPRLITACIGPSMGNAVANVSKVTFSTSLDGLVAFNPVNYLYTTATTFGTQKALYKEWRLKQCKVHAMYASLGTTPLATWTQGLSVVVAYGWVRNAAYGAGSPVAYTTLALQPNTIQKVWALNIEKPELWTTVTATNVDGEGNWLNTSVAPATAPNSGMFFMPELKLNFELPSNSASGDLNWNYEIEFIVEFRGSLQ